MDKTTTYCKLNKFLHSEVNILIQHIIVQDQDGQNNYKYIKVGLPNMKWKMTKEMYSA